MVEIERSPGQGVRIGPYTLRVVAVHSDGVALALDGPGEEREPDGPPPVVPSERFAWAVTAPSHPAGLLPA